MVERHRDGFWEAGDARNGGAPSWVSPTDGEASGTGGDGATVSTWITSSVHLFCPVECVVVLLLNCDVRHLIFGSKSKVVERAMLM